MFRLLLFTFLMASVSGRTLEKRILMSDTSNVHNLELKIQELTAKVDALSISAPDHCPDGYLRRHQSCYKIHHDTVSWPEAVTFCKSLDSHLVTLNSHEEYDYLKQKLMEVQASYKSTAFWIGASDAIVDGQWMWIDSGNPAANLAWGAGEPNNGINSNCASIYSVEQFKIDDSNCHSAFHFICEIDLASNS